MNPITFTVRGTPAARPRSRSMAFKIKGSNRWTARAYNPSTTDLNAKTSAERAWARANLWDAAVKHAVLKLLPKEPLNIPLRIDVEAYFERPKNLLTKKAPNGPIPHTKKPDRDNLDKAVLDALKSIGMLKDDCVVCQGEVQKWYVARDCAPGIVVKIQPAK